jgi:hypothetical protein
MKCPIRWPRDIAFRFRLATDNTSAGVLWLLLVESGLQPQIQAEIKQESAPQRIGLLSALWRARCLVPGFDGAFLSHDSKDALWEKFYSRCRSEPR